MSQTLKVMDILVSKVDTPYFVTMDADCTFLLKDWDEILISKIDGKIKVHLNYLLMKSQGFTADSRLLQLTTQVSSPKFSAVR